MQNAVSLHQREGDAGCVLLSSANRSVYKGLYCSCQYDLSEFDHLEKVAGNELEQDATYTEGSDSMQYQSPFTAVRMMPSLFSSLVGPQLRFPAGLVLSCKIAVPL